MTTPGLIPTFDRVADNVSQGKVSEEDLRKRSEMLTKERVKRFRMVHMPSDVDLEGSGAEGRDGFFRRTTESPGG